MSTMKVAADFALGKRQDGRDIDLEVILDGLKSGGEALAKWTLDEILDVIDAFGQALMDRNNTIHRRYPTSGLPYIAQWCRRSSLEALVDSALGTCRKIDQFVTDEARKDRAYRAYPCGLVVHWMAGNVPTLGFLSLIQGLLAKNANLLKQPSGADGMLGEILDVMACIGEGPRSGAELVKAIAAIKYDHDRLDVAKHLSLSADARLMWGSDESIEKISQLPTKQGCADLVFGNKTSIILISAEALANGDQDTMARRIVLDVSIFEQKACASPHTIFIETDNDAVLDGFAVRLHAAFERSLKTLPKTPPSQREVAAILNLRAKYDAFHKAWYSTGTEFSILSDDQVQLGPAIGNRTIYLRKAQPLERILDLITPKVQSVGIAAGKSEYDRITSAFAACGVQRFAPLGAMTHFESPWDGYFPIHALVRWASRPSQPTLGE